MANFETLWRNFPEKDIMKKKCTNKQKDSNNPFGNYCAILLGECFNQSGIDISLFKGARCWSHLGKKHILLAEDLANGLKRHTPPGFGKLQNPARFLSN